MKHGHASRDAMSVSGTCRTQTRARYAPDTCQTRSIRVRHESTILTRPTRSNLSWTRFDEFVGLWDRTWPDTIYNPKPPIFPHNWSLSNPQRRRTLTCCLLAIEGVRRRCNLVVVLSQSKRSRRSCNLILSLKPRRSATSQRSRRRPLEVILSQQSRYRPPLVIV